VEVEALAIEFSREAMETVRAAVVDGFYKLARGGLEVGGVLFGQRSGDSVRILASRPIACEHAFGPSFVLSENDEAGLRTLLESATSDPELKGLVPAGWYHSHTRSEISLSDRDLEVHNRHFREPWQVALVVRPEKMRPARARFFLREPGGSVTPDSSHGEFLVAPLPKQRRAEPAAAAKQAPTGTIQAAAPAGRSSRLPWFLFTVALIAAIALAAYAFRGYWLPRPPAPLKPPPEMVEAVRERDKLAGELEKLKADFEQQIQRNRELEAEVEALKKRPGAKR
jgi:proteasome lid subunit RPN8/RPN11